MKKAFTLIELLVVITIVSILAALLFPVFAQAKMSARNTEDLSNIRQIGIAFQLYSSDSDDLCVPVSSWNDPTITPFTNPNGPALGTKWNSWALNLSRYSSKEVFHSPFMPKTANWWTGPCATSNGMPITSTYSYNWFLGADTSYPDYGDGYRTTPDGTKFDTPTNQSTIVQPSSTVAFELSQTTSPYGNDFGCDYNMIESPDWNNQIQFRALYRNGGNLAYVDGHAKLVVAGIADSAGTGYPNCHGAPSHSIWIWNSRNMWTYPFYPNSTGGFQIEPIANLCSL